MKLAYYYFMIPAHVHSMHCHCVQSVWTQILGPRVIVCRVIYTNLGGDKIYVMNTVADM